MNVSVKTLGVHINTRLNWNDEFDYVKNKMTVKIKKVMRKEMKMHQAHMCFDVHVLTNFFWVWCSAVQLKKYKRIEKNL